MISWLDQLNALIVAAGGMLIIVGLMVLRSSGLIDGTRLTAGQALQRSLTEQLQVDLDHLGVGRPPGAPAILEATATRFAFHSVADTLGTPAVVAYEADLSGAGRVVRSLDGVPGPAHEVTSFTLTPLDELGQPATSLADVRAISVHVDRDLPFDAPSDEVPLSWSTVVRPIALQYTY